MRFSRSTCWQPSVRSKTSAWLSISVRLYPVPHAAPGPEHCWMNLAWGRVCIIGLASFWVQQRTLNKANDPGLWDTLMGGMVSAADTTETALARETWEEAGLQVADLRDMRYGGRFTTCRPSSDGQGAGYVREHIDWYCCTVPEGLVPSNQDGEVEQFCLMDAGQLLSAMQRGEFTTEAALILADVMKLP